MLQLRTPLAACRLPAASSFRLCHSLCTAVPAAAATADAAAAAPHPAREAQLPSNLAAAAGDGSPGGRQRCARNGVHGRRPDAEGPAAQHAQPAAADDLPAVGAGAQRPCLHRGQEAQGEWQSPGGTVASDLQQLCARFVQDLQACTLQHSSNPATQGTHHRLAQHS